MTAGTSEPAATLERRGRVGLITFNRPHAMNAVNSDLAGAVGGFLEEIDGDPGLRVAVVTGAGRAFCAGADLKDVAAGRDVGAPGHPEWGFAGLVEHEFAKPLIAAVNGYALGGGAEIVLASDLAVLSETASLGLPEVKRGLFAAAAGLINLPRQVPTKIAMEVALLGELVPADEALRWGLVNRVVPADQLLATALELAEKAASNAPGAMRTSKRIIRAALGRGAAWDGDVRTLQAEETVRTMASADALEGARAFAEKRQPQWADA
ncbi:enoyl-CoA hydratase-related protein [Geodermatophilus sabuli]|uniref:Crotonobetainyl-CoA hydratase n=1 Tax=Geodermatophilus sabuli TaxID=1564158 RepID=A0A285E692_9ACTN|nr:enoyl-CoA hydratase-related protein [Geodermatophilus sabuli]MBB3082501.1 crotonobetainyl-CoA hydratase [Geodermatophilus sabuli]SNX94629.1 crotonobetainyl-CoA hydratase [Geodermatophilus sabuli]